MIPEVVVIVITYEHIVFMNNMMFAGQGPLVVKKGRHLVLPYEILNFEALPQLEPYSPLYHFPILFQFFTFAFSSFYLVPVFLSKTKNIFHLRGIWSIN